MANPIPPGGPSRGPEPSREQRAAASRYVLRAARDQDDLRLLLDALGLNTPTLKEETSRDR